MPDTDWSAVLYRFVSGRPLDGKPRADGGYLRRGRKALTATGHASRWARLPGWQRQAWRLGVPAAVYGAVVAVQAEAQVTVGVAATVAALGGVQGARAVRRRWKMRRFNATYIRPTKAALSMALGNAPIRLRVDPQLGNLMLRLVKPLSPAEKAIRAWYGQRVEPVLRWAPDRVMRAAWAVQAAARPLTARLAVLRRPAPEDAGPRIVLEASVPYVTPEQQQFVKGVVTAKIPAGELVEKWNQVGEKVYTVWTVRRRPPAHVGYADLDARLPGLKEWEFFLGLGVGGKPVVVSLHEDSPHIACSAGSGAGKSALAQLVAVQVLARGGRVLILDRKGSHRWARGLPGVLYCSSPADMHAALIGAASDANARNSQAMEEAEDWVPGQRVLVIFEEMNATISMLRAYWDSVRQPGDPKTSPAIQAFRELMYMGRSAWYHLFGIAQMLTAQTTGGPESRENFGIRLLARYTKNAWMMLAPEASMPRPSRHLGRWQVVVGGVATECQVAYLRPHEARILVHKMSPTGACTGDVPGQAPIKGDRAARDTPAPVDPHAERVTLRTVIERGVCPWAYEATKKRMQRARKSGRTVPVPVGKDGSADLFRLGDLILWIESELVP